MGGSSTSAIWPSPGSPRSGRGSARSASPGSRELRRLALRHGIRPSKALGQHFLVDPNLARAIAADAGVGPGDRVLEVGAGFGSLTVALAETGCEVLALELDRRIVPALREVVGALPNVRIEEVDATRADWRALLGTGPWAAVSNLPYNVSVPLVLAMLDVPAIERSLVMVQREVGDRFVAGPGDAAYGPASVRVAYRADAAVARAIPSDVFWPRPKIGSVLVRLTPHPPRVGVDPAALFRIVDQGFAERRKTMTTALRRLGIEDATGVLRGSGVDPSARAERLGLDDFARAAEAAISSGWRP